MESGGHEGRYAYGAIAHRDQGSPSQNQGSGGHHDPAGLLSSSSSGDQGGRPLTTASGRPIPPHLQRLYQQQQALDEPSRPQDKHRSADEQVCGKSDSQGGREAPQAGRRLQLGR